MPRYTRHISPQEQLIYDHLLERIEAESPDEMIERFRHLFIDGSKYPDAEVAEALDAVIASKTASEEFRYVLNRCCHILINRWQSRPHSRLEIPKLIHLFETVSEVSTLRHLRYRSSRRLHDLVKDFRNTDQYVALRRLAQVLSRVAEEVESGSRPLGTLIRRYPYLYEHCLLTDDNLREQQSTVRQVQSEVQRQFELDLSRYVTYQIRRANLARTNPQAVQRLIHPVTNPTLLTDGVLNRAVKHYVGRVDGGRTYQDLAKHFMSHTAHIRTYRDFKDDLYQYIVAGVDIEYGKRKFNNQLYGQLNTILPESHSRPLDDFLIVRTCSQLLNFLVVDSPRSPQHFVLVDLLMNLGPILTMGLLLRIVLLCRKVRPYLERRFSILFSHYEAYSRDAVEWLIGALEMLNVALTTNFGRLDVSFVA